MAEALTTIKDRADFLAARAGLRRSTPAFQIEARRREEDPAAPVRYGLTATKRLGGAVVRNRARRRLRSLARDVVARLGEPGWDYVLIAREEALTRPFAVMKAELERAMEMLQKSPRGDPEKRRGRIPPKPADR